jgi:hypothetical protein
MVVRHDLLKEISTYCRLAGLLMPSAAGLPQPPQSHWHVRRILHQRASVRTSPGWRQKIVPLLWHLTSHAYSSTRKPSWIWRHPCHSRSDIPLEERLACFAGRLLGRTGIHKKPCDVKTG